MGVRAKAQVVLAVPVQQIVPAGKAGLCEVGYLILGVAARGQRVRAGKVKPGGPVIVRQMFGRGLAPGGAGLQLQQVARCLLYTSLHSGQYHIFPVRQIASSGVLAIADLADLPPGNPEVVFLCRHDGMEANVYTLSLIHI